MNPLEAGLEGDARPGQARTSSAATPCAASAMRSAARDDQAGRRGRAVPRLDDFWPVLDAEGAEIGVARWAVWSYALDTSIAIALVEAGAAAGERFVLRAPDGDRPAHRHAVPFV